MAEPNPAELVFVVDIDTFEGKGFVGSSEYEGVKLNIAFDGEDSGTYLTPEMCKRIRARKGAKLTLVAERETAPVVISSVLVAARERVRVSSSSLYKILGEDGGGIFRIRKS
ncbi:MAG TPA: hypothetical protein VEJ36_06975 [Nitrososphaerales archaeon]|nr:hypothetical protein [Nitrososphaerales archaeon]